MNLPNLLGAALIATVAILAWVIFAEGAHGATYAKPHFKADFAYLAKSPKYKTSLQGVPLTCEQYLGKGRVIVDCTVDKPAKAVKPSGPPA